MKIGSKMKKTKNIQWNLELAGYFLAGGLLSLSLAGNTYADCTACQVGTPAPAVSSSCGGLCGPVCVYSPPTYKVVCETVYDEKKVVTYKPVWETEIRTRPVTVQRKIAETEMREERYSVRIPVTEIQFQEQTEERVRYVPETCEKEEISYCLKPVQKVIEQEKVCVVKKPVCETRMETRTRTINEQVTSYETKYVDQGAFTDQLVLKPNRGLFANRLSYQEAKAVTNEETGEVTKQRAGLYWTPSNKGRYEVQKIWVPNPQPVQVPRTYTVPRQVCEQVPVTTTRMVEERVVQKVPVTVTEMVREQVVTKVPVTTMKPVKETVVKQVPVKVCKWKEEEHVRQVPYTTWKTVDECTEETYEVKVCRMVPEEKIVRVPRVVTRYIPIDACGNEILSDRSLDPAAQMNVPRVPAPVPTVQPTPETPTVQPTPETPTVQPTPETPTVQPTPETPTVQPTPNTPAVQTSPADAGTQNGSMPYTPNADAAEGTETLPSPELANGTQETGAAGAGEQKTFAEKHSIIDAPEPAVSADTLTTPAVSPAPEAAAAALGTETQQTQENVQQEVPAASPAVPQSTVPQSTLPPVESTSMSQTP